MLSISLQPLSQTNPPPSFLTLKKSPVLGHALLLIIKLASPHADG